MPSVSFEVTFKFWLCLGQFPFYLSSILLKMYAMCFVFQGGIMCMVLI